MCHRYLKRGSVYQKSIDPEKPYQNQLPAILFRIWFVFTSKSLNSMVVRFNHIITPANGSSYPKANLQQILKLCKVAIVSSSNPHAADMNVKLHDAYIYRQETSSS